jgi:RNA polymerase sigma-70 factor (ECF subfamily)
MDELAVKSARGDVQAFAELVEREQAGVRGYLASRLRAPETAEDLAQETFIVAYRKLKEFDASQSLWPWLRGIAHNLVLNERRKLARNEALREEMLWKDATGPGPETHGGAIESLGRCLERLSGRMREFVRLRYDENRPLQDIAGRLKLTDGSARVAHVRILRSLRQCIETLGTEAQGSGQGSWQ